MSRNFTLTLKSLALALAFTTANGFAAAQTLAQAEPGRQHQNRHEKQSLTGLLEQVATEKGVFFLYEPSILEGATASAEVDLRKDTRQLLNEILPAANLRYQQVDKRNFVIKKAKKPKGSLSSTKKAPAPAPTPPPLPVVPDRLVTGVVSNFRTGEPLIGVTVVVKGRESTGTVTDIDGKYSLRVPEEFNTLVFSYIGFEPQEVEINNREVVNVWLNEAATQLDEVVITAVGIEANRRSLGYSVEEVSSQEIENANEANIVSALSGKTAGVFVTTASGAPGAGANIRIRGNKSINGSNKPLFIVDGVPIDNSSSGNAAAGVDVSNRAIDINPNDIESISILKGPAATALYGIRAANGAVVITTKRGKAGKPRITIKSAYGLSQANKLPARQYTYAQGTFTGGEAVYRGPETAEANSYGPPMDQLEYDGDDNYPYDRNGRLVPLGQGNGQPANIYRPEEDFFDNGHTFDNNVSVAGGSERLAYYLSAGQFYQQGIVPRSDWGRYSFKGNFDVQLSERLSAGSNTTVVRSGGDRKNRGNALSGVSIGLYRTPVSFDNGDGKTGREAASDPSTYIFPDGEQRAYRGSDRYDNPYWSVNRVPFTDEVNRVIQSLSLRYEITPWMAASYKLGLDHYSDKREAAWDIHSGSEVNGRIDLQTRLSTDLNSDFLLLIDKDLGEDFRLDATFGHNFFDSEFTARTVSGNEMTKQGFFHISNAANIETNESISRRRLYGVFGDIRLNWRNIAFLNLTGRNDWSSTLPKENNSFFYPTVSAGLEFTELLGLTDNKILSYGKIRASYGEVGNDAGLYLTANYFQRAAADGDNLLPANEFPAFGANAFERAGTLGNANLKAETTATFEAGADLKFFLGRSM